MIQKDNSANTPLLRRYKTHRASDAAPIGHHSPKLKIIVMGGLEEVGRNMTLLECDNEIIIIDMGLQFPEENMPGIDYIINDISYLKDKTDLVKGVIITHGHYDHIGGIPHLMPQLGNPPMFTGELSAGIIQKRYAEFKGLPKLKITMVNDDSVIRLGKNFIIEFVRLNHSIPDTFGIVVKTPLGTIFHTGDYKFDYTPVDGKPADLNRLALIGHRGVLALLGDSTSAESSGHQVSEKIVGEELRKVFEQAPGRIIIGTFASQITRVQQLIQLAQDYDRKIVLEGSSMKSNVEISHQLGYIKMKPKTLIESDEAANYPDNKLVFIGTGAQGEKKAFLMKMASEEHKVLSFKQGDTVIFSSSVIPGNERTIQSLKDLITRKGARIIHYQLMDIHAGGHAKKEDIKLMLRLIKPQYYIPIEANHFLLQANAEIAADLGLPRSNIFVADNGQTIEFSRLGATQKVIGKLTSSYVPAEYVMVDGLGVGDVSEVVLRDRQMMAEDGMFVVIATVKHSSNIVIGNPDIISRGFIYMKESRELLNEARKKVKKIIETQATPTDINIVKQQIRDELGLFLYKKTKRRPMVLPVIIEV